MAAPKARRRMALVRSMGQTIAPPAMPPRRARRALSRVSRNLRRFGFIVVSFFTFLVIGYWLLAVGSSYCHAELVSASVRGEGLVMARGEILN